MSNFVSTPHLQAARRRSSLGIALALTAALASGCSTSDDTTNPSSNQSDAQSGSGAAVTGSDQSEQIMASAKGDDKPIATTSGSYTDADSKQVKLTLEVFALQARPNQTVLSYKVTSTTDATLDTTVKNWDKQPTLTPKGAETSLQSISVARGNIGPSIAGNFPCLCTGYPGTNPKAPSQSVIYGALPEGTTEVAVAMGTQLKVNVPVTR